MNKEKRQRLLYAQSLLSKASDIVADVRDDEQDDFDNLPESIQDAARGQQMSDAVDAMEDAIESIEEASSCIDKAAG